jgi:hypothetical protein
VHFHELPVSLRIDALPFREHLLQTPRRHAREVAVCVWAAALKSALA